MYSFGDGGYSQTGAADNILRVTPRPIEALAGFQGLSLSSGEFFSLCITRNPAQFQHKALRPSFSALEQPIMPPPDATQAVVNEATIRAPRFAYHSWPLLPLPYKQSQPSVLHEEWFTLSQSFLRLKNASANAAPTVSHMNLHEIGLSGSRMPGVEMVRLEGKWEALVRVRDAFLIRRKYDKRARTIQRQARVWLAFRFIRRLKELCWELIARLRAERAADAARRRWKVQLHKASALRKLLRQQGAFRQRFDIVARGVVNQGEDDSGKGRPQSALPFSYARRRRSIATASPVRMPSPDAHQRRRRRSVLWSPPPQGKKDY